MEHEHWIVVWWDREGLCAAWEVLHSRDKALEVYEQVKASRNAADIRWGQVIDEHSIGGS